LSGFIEVEHVTSYRHAQAVELGKRHVMIRPHAAHDIPVQNASLEVQPVARQQWVHDVFSNSVALVDPWSRPRSCASRPTSPSSTSGCATWSWR
jgi:hypothetical protein